MKPLPATNMLLGRAPVSIERTPGPSKLVNDEDCLTDIIAALGFSDAGNCAGTYAGTHYILSVAATLVCHLITTTCSIPRWRSRSWSDLILPRPGLQDFGRLQHTVLRVHG
ncbi:hypothetical protein COCOBI_01-1120 [Coccomyxa sp. Obi]|nr:hypothetical protein COCOBI_01-1120 [Coccomyxa sp. Obi]